MYTITRTLFEPPLISSLLQPDVHSLLLFSGSPPEALHSQAVDVFALPDESEPAQWPYCQAMSIHAVPLLLNITFAVLHIHDFSHFSPHNSMECRIILNPRGNIDGLSLCRS